MKKPKAIKLEDVIKEFYKEFPEEQGVIENRTQELLIQTKLREERKKAKMSQKQLALKSGVGQDKISRIERGEYNFTLETLQKIANGMGKKVRIEIV